MDWGFSTVAAEFAVGERPGRRLIGARMAALPMSRIPVGQLEVADWEIIAAADVKSGVPFQEGDLLLARITPCFENGKQAIARDVPGGVGVATTEVFPIRPTTGRCDLAFLAFYLLDQGVRADLASKMEGATGRQRLPRGVLGGLPVPIPPLSEQTRIVRLLSRLQRLAGLELKRVALLARLKAALLAKLFREGLRGEPLRETEIGPLPASWRVASLGEVTRRMQYGLSIRGGPAGAMPILRMNCQQDGRVEFRNLQFVTLDERQRAAFLLQPGDILFNRTNSFELVGRAAIFDSPREAVFASYLIRVSTDEAAALPGFLNHYLCAAAAQARLKSLATRGVSQSNISASRLRTFPVPIPQMAEQREMASTLDQLTLSVIGARRRAALLQSLFSAILARLMTGELRLPAEPQEADG